MNKLHNDNGYRVIDHGRWYYITIASTKHNQYRNYEYDAGCGTIQEVEQELRNHTFEEIVKLYKEQYVYLDCIEAIY